MSELCPSCAAHPQQHNEGICRECHLRKLIEVYERRKAIIELEQEWDVARQRSHRNGNGRHLKEA